MIQPTTSVSNIKLNLLININIRIRKKKTKEGKSINETSTFYIILFATIIQFNHEIHTKIT